MGRLRHHGLMPPQPPDERWQRLAADLAARMREMGVSPLMLARRSGIEVKRIRALLDGRRPQTPLGEIGLTRLAEVLAVDPAVLMGRLDGSLDAPLTAVRTSPVAAEGPAARLAVLVPRLQEADQLMIERFVLRLLGQ